MEFCDSDELDCDEFPNEKSNDTESDSTISASGKQPPKKKSKKVPYYKQKYNRTWEKDPELRLWLAPCKDNKYNALCTVCGKTLTAGLTELKRHGKSKKHEDNVAISKTTRSISTIMGPADSTKSDARKAKIKVAAFIVEHHLPFQIMDHLSDLVSTTFTDSKIASEFSSKHTKTRKIVKNVLAKKFRNSLEETLRCTKFSIIIDESTDISTKKQLAVAVRYYCDKEKKVGSQFFKLVEVAHGDANTLVMCLVSLFEKQKIPFENIIGYASDTTNVMFGQYHSVVSMLKDRIPNLFVMKCLCHTSHLCASYACQKLPKAIEDLIRDIYSHFSHSAKRLAEYKEFQHFTNTEPHRLLRPAQTRWLSLEQCVLRVIEQWAALEAYFENSAENDRLVSSQNILSALKNPIFKLYLCFLKYILPKFTHFNKLFQSEKPNIHFLAKTLASTYKSFLSCYMTNTYLKSCPLKNIDPLSHSDMLPLSSMSMGEEVSQFLCRPDIVNYKHEVRGFLEHVQLFYIESACQIKQRFPIDDPVLKSLSILNPDTMSSTTLEEVKEVALRFPNIVTSNDIRELDNEWRNLQYTDPSDIPEYSGHREDVASFWGKVSDIHDPFDNNTRFPTIGKLTKSLLSLPHSNADVERIFSQVVLTKVKQRNKLKTSTLDALLMVKQGLPTKSCVDFTPTTDMCKCINTSMYSSDSDSD